MSGNKDSQTAAAEQTDSNTMTRRRALQMTAAAGAVAAVGSGSAAAQEETGLREISVDYDATLSHESRLESTVEIEEADLSEMDRYGYVDDNGETTSLVSDGFTERTREDADEDVDPTPHNPDSYNPTTLRNESEFAAFPRGVTETNADDETVEISALDAAEWTSASGSMTLANVDDYSLNVTGSSASGATESFTHPDWTISSGEERKVLQLILDIDAVASGDLVELEIVHSGSTNPTVALVDGDGDETTDTVAASTTADGVVYQMQLGDLVSSIDTISELILRVDGSPDVTIHGLNLDAESKWTLGEQEYLNADSEIEIQTIEQHSGGSLSIKSVDTLGDRLGSSMLNVSHDVEQWASDLPTDSKLAYDDASPSGYDRERRLTQGMTHLLPSQYALSWSDTDLYLVGGVPSGRYINIGYSTNVDPVPESQQDLLDLSLIDVSGQIEIGTDSEIQLTSTVLPGEEATVVADIVLSSDEVSNVESTGFGGGAGGSAGGGGWLSGIQGIIVALAATIGGVIGLRRRGGS